MKIRIKRGQGAVLATHVEKGEARCPLYITPWGCSFDTPLKTPKNADASPREYTVEAGVCAKAIEEALAAKHEGLLSRIEIVEELEKKPLPVKKAPAKKESAKF